MVANTSESRPVSQPEMAYIAELPVAEANQKGKKGTSQPDSLSKSQIKGQGKGSHLDRPELPPGKSSQPGYLELLATAYGGIYSSMTRTLIDQSGDFSRLQDISQTMSQAIQESSLLAVQKEHDQTVKADKLEHQQKKMAKEDKQLNDFTYYAGIALMVGTLAVGFATGGAADAALPEEEAGLAAATASTMDLGDVEMADLSIEDPAVESSDPEGSSGASSSSASTSVQPGESLEQLENANQVERTQEQTANDLSKSEKANSKSASKWRKNIASLMKVLAKGAWGGAVSSTLSLPQLVGGIQKKELAAKQRSLAKVQEQTGAALAEVGKNNAFYQFYQQLVQRKSSVVSELAEQLGNVLQTYSDITKAYQQISYGLAAAV